MLGDNHLLFGAGYNWLLPLDGIFLQALQGRTILSAPFFFS